LNAKDRNLLSALQLLLVLKQLRVPGCCTRGMYRQDVARARVSYAAFADGVSPVMTAQTFASPPPLPTTLFKDSPWP
jgi:hypothetical protein